MTPNKCVQQPTGQDMITEVKIIWFFAMYICTVMYSGFACTKIALSLGYHTTSSPPLSLERSETVVTQNIKAYKNIKMCGTGLTRAMASVRGGPFFFFVFVFVFGIPSLSGDSHTWTICISGKEGWWWHDTHRSPAAKFWLSKKEVEAELWWWVRSSLLEQRR